MITSKTKSPQINQSKSTRTPAQVHGLDKYFKISERGSTIGREVRGGIVTFFAMAYILVVNPSILSNALAEGSNGIHALVAGTALVAGVFSILMGVFANFPLAMAAGMGLNAMVSFSLCLAMGLTFAEAMGLIFWEGVILLVLVLTGFRQAVFRAVPKPLRSAISVGIGLFIAFVGLINAGIIRPGGTPVQLGIDGSLQGWPSLIFIVGLFVIAALFVRKVPGAILLGIVIATALAFIVQHFAAVPLGSEEVPTGWSTTVPALQGSIVSAPDFSTIGQISFFGAFQKLGPVAAILVIFSLMLANFFDALGTMVAVGAEADLLDSEGTPLATKQILVVESLGAIAGGLGGASSNTVYVESAAGVGEGARTGLASIITGSLFLVALFFSPLVALVPAEAASTALVFVGFLMMTQVKEIDWRSVDIGLPAFLMIALMPFGYSITVGIGAGFVSYTFIQVAKGSWKKIHPLMWVVTAMFVVYFAMGPIQGLLGV